MPDVAGGCFLLLLYILSLGMKRFTKSASIFLFFYNFFYIAYCLFSFVAFGFKKTKQIKQLLRAEQTG
uniref:Uncharacterized protein n=1 Tax=Daphnia magna TaxID=35525 RepID=A0A0P6CIT1_9CRUS